MDHATDNISKITIPEPAATQFGWVSYPPGGTLGPRMQTGLQFVAIESGEATITVQGRRRHLAAGEVCVLEPGRREHFRFAREKKTVHTWCTMYFEAPDRAIARRVTGLPFSIRLTPTLRDLIAVGLESRWTSDYTRQPLTNALGRAVYHAFVAAARTSESEQPNCPHPGPVERACAFVASNLEQPIQVEDLARAAGISPNQLTRLFKRHLRTTPSRYLWQTRTQQGVNLLQNTGLSIAEIAYRVGFTTPFHFSRLSKQLYGLSPKALRQEFWGDGGRSPEPK